MSWNPFDTARDIRDFAYKNTGMDNFMNIARGINNGTMNYSLTNLSDPNSFFGNLGAGALEAGLMFAPGGGALKAGKLAREAAGLGRVKGAATSIKATTKALAPKPYLKNVGQTIKQGGAKGVVKTGAKRGGGYYGLEKVSTYALPAAVADSGQSVDRSVALGNRPLGVVNPQGDYSTQGGMAQPGSYLTPAEQSYFNSLVSSANTGASAEAKNIQDLLKLQLMSENQMATGAGQDLLSQGADYGMAGQPSMEVGVDYINNLYEAQKAQDRLNAQEKLSEIDKQRINAINNARLAKMRAEQDARWSMFQNALPDNYNLSIGGQ